MNRGRYLILIALVSGSICVWEAVTANDYDRTSQAFEQVDSTSDRTESAGVTPASSESAQSVDSAEVVSDSTLEVKTGGEELLVAQKYNDGQANAPAAEATTEPVQPLAKPAYEANADVDPAASTNDAIEATPESPVAKEVPQTVFTDYKAAMKEAAEDRKMLFIYFHETRPNAAQQAFEKLTLADPEIQEKLKRFVIVRLARTASITVDGEEVNLLQHTAFAEMLGRQGVAIVDLVHETSDYYGHVVSTFPFTPGKYYRKQALSIILDLPPGTLTQRTMIFAVRIHPEAPASTQGVFHTVLADEAKSHAIYQAAILVQGHHSWDARFQRINAKLPSGVLAQEVVAESWPNESLVEAAVDCVHSWRQSPGHWGAVRSRQPLFGYDIKRGRNGIWYATGIFGRR